MTEHLPLKQIATARTLDGARVAGEIKQEVRDGVNEFVRLYDAPPALAVVRVGDDAASLVYVRNKIRTSEELGFRSEHHALPASTSEAELLLVIGELNRRDDVDGILVQLPLPQGIDDKKIIESIDPAKDVDGFHPLNVGRLVAGQESAAPCTPAGIIELLKRYDIEMRGQSACVVGRSNIVGRPMAQLFLLHDATVTICHSRTVDLASVTRHADILVVAIGRAAFIRSEHIKTGAVVIDVGMNQLTDAEMIDELFDDREEAARRHASFDKRGYTLVGDVHPAQAAKKAAWLTPVPGGVGLLTVAMLMRNTLHAANKRRVV